MHLVYSIRDTEVFRRRHANLTCHTRLVREIETMNFFKIMQETRNQERRPAFHVARYDDGAVYSLADRHFRPADQASVDQITQLEVGSGIVAGLYCYDLEITPEFKDGLYVVFYHDTALPDCPVYDWESFGVRHGATAGELNSQLIAEALLSQLAGRTFTLRAVAV